MITAWHFRTHRGKLRDGKPIVDGQWLEYDGDIIMCKSGLHASRRAIDALWHAPGPWVSLCEIEDIDEEACDKLVCRRRKHLWTYDANDVLRGFARWCARSVMHLWDPPEVVRRYLETGDESIRDAARAAARDAAWAARAAARDAAQYAARDAAWAARDAAWAAWAAWAVAGDAQNEELESRLLDGLVEN